MPSTQIDSLVERMLLDAWGAFARHWPDLAEVGEALHHVWPLVESEPQVPAIIGPSTRVAWRWEPSTLILSVSIRTLKNGRWNADVVALLDPDHRWVYLGTTAPCVFVLPLAPEERVNPDAVIVVGDDDRADELAAHLMTNGMQVVVAREDFEYGSLDRHFPLLMRGWGLVSIARLRGSQPVVHLALREASPLRSIVSLTPWSTTDFMDSEAESNRSIRAPFMAWHSERQLHAIENAVGLL